jgi:hypothetical protein
MGPYIQVATFCEEVTRDQNTQSLTVSRFVTAATLGMINGPRTMPPLPIPYPLVVTMWGGGITGSHRVRIVPEDPHGDRLDPVYDKTFEFLDDPLYGLDLVLQLPTLVTREGIYLFAVIISAPDGSDERTVGRVPLQVSYSRVPADPAAVNEQPAETTLRQPA